MTQHNKEYIPRHAANSPEEATIKVEYNENYMPRHSLVEKDHDVQKQKDNDTKNNNQLDYDKETSVREEVSTQQKPHEVIPKEENKKSLLWLWTMLAAVAITALVAIPYFGSQDNNDDTPTQEIYHQEQIKEGQEN